MSYNRRHFLKAAAAGTVISLAEIPRLGAAPEPILPGGDTPINIIIPRDYVPLADSVETYRRRLANATLALIEEHYSGQKLPVWDLQPHEIDLEKRLYHIAYWVIQGVQNYQSIYPVDPVWVVAQIMKESYFYEFAVSSALAAGICQFIQPTAIEYEMLCAGTLDGHAAPPYRMPELANQAAEYYRWRRERSQYRRDNRPPAELSLREALEVIRDRRGEQFQTTTERQLRYMEAIEVYDQQVIQARDAFRTYLRENLAGRDIFNEQDLKFILGFDERFTYRKPAFSMVKMLARGLRARNGNILAAAIGYNAGLSSTQSGGMYKPYGQIPAIAESTTYLSQVLINHYEIAVRMQ